MNRQRRHLAAASIEAIKHMNEINDGVATHSREITYIHADPTFSEACRGIYYPIDVIMGRNPCEADDESRGTLFFYGPTGTADDHYTDVLAHDNLHSGLVPVHEMRDEPIELYERLIHAINATTVAKR